MLLLQPWENRGARHVQEKNNQHQGEAVGRQVSGAFRKDLVLQGNLLDCEPKREESFVDPAVGAAQLRVEDSHGLIHTHITLDPLSGKLDNRYLGIGDSRDRLDILLRGEPWPVLQSGIFQGMAGQSCSR